MTDKQSSHGINMTIPNQSEYIGVVRLTASGICSRLNYHLEDIEDVKIAISEACSNAILHAYSDDDDGNIDITFNIDGNQLTVRVVDQGKGFDVKNLKDPLEEKDDRERFGLGIKLIENLMTDMEISSTLGEGTVIQFSYKPQSL